MLPGPHIQARPLGMQEVLTYAMGVALAWYGLFHFNQWLFVSFSVSDQVSWIFLPAAIRMLAVVLFGWAGVFGLLLGSLFTNPLFDEVSPVAALTVSFLSALGPWMAFRACTHWLHLPEDLTGLQPRHLLILSAVGAFFTSVPHCLFYYVSGISPRLFADLITMFTGDLIGTLVVLYVAALVIRLLVPRSSSSG